MQMAAECPSSGRCFAFREGGAERDRIQDAQLFTSVATRCVDFLRAGVGRYGAGVTMADIKDRH
jgi:hypothetical protein